MASEQGMSGIDVRAMTCELQEKLPLWIDKVYQFDTKTLGIRLNGENKAKYLLFIESGRRAHLVADLPEPPKNPPHFAMLLRKHLSGGKVLSIRQHGLERVLIFAIGKGTTVFNLIIELFDNGNVILADDTMTIIKPLWHHRFKDREVVPGVPYTFGSPDPTASEESLAAFLKTDERDLVRALAIGCMLGGMYAEYICKEAGLEKSIPAATADPARIFSSLQALFRQVEEARTPIIAAKHCEPINLRTGEETTAYPTFSLALEAFYPMTKAEKKATSRPKIAKEDRIRSHQQAAIKKFDRSIAQAEEVVNAIYENYPFIAQVIGTLAAASKTHSWQEIEKRIRAAPSEETKKITAFFPGEAAVEIDLGKRIKVFVNESVEQNAGHYYDVIKKFKKKKAGAVTAMETVATKKQTKRREFVPLKKQWYHRFRWFITSDGAVVLGGRDATQNEELVKKYMAGGDTFVHADVHGASVVLVKGKTERMDEVARFAASYSGAWRSGHFSADVYSALPSQVSKTPEAGEFVSRGSFIVRGERTYYRNIPLSTGIGLMLDPHAAVIGGPPSAVRQKVKAFVELRPGQFEPNDVAKKVLRILKSKIPEDDVKALKGILNTEKVAAFTPPGGSDIVGHHEG
ncbi:ribosome rescue protein RqcH [Methanoregula formicica]|uniref:Putative RNA-binding protein, snRNP like protein n=1 Tax=Methanoregula formicica (strain DSM 22288 / NBRC 105244 / SMSP) TaxID=593750 RepID=L0HHJ7_METFS|nr:ribosome rescue protein RqcH [Methanoregula formicica]AGB02559.1 putative RNA-binding protein, snRNP like protein [Methanoregula formicica SMSP]